MKKIEISYKTLILIVLFVILCWVIYQIKNVLIGLFLCLILMSSLNPTIQKMESKRIPRWLAILSLYLIIVVMLAVSLGWLVPPLIEQTGVLINNIPNFFKEFNILGINEQTISQQLSQFTSIPANLVKLLFQLFSNIVVIITLGVITFYLLLERKNFDHYLQVIFGNEKQKQIQAIIDKTETRLGTWVRGELVLMFLVGVLNYIGFLIIGIKYALPLALLAFLFEIIPNVGPVLAAFPAVLVGLSISPYHALAVAGWCFLVQQLENSYLVPKVVKIYTGVNPLIALISLAIGFELAGIGGAILAIPTYIVVETVTKELLFLKKQKQ